MSSLLEAYRKLVGDKTADTRFDRQGQHDQQMQEYNQMVNNPRVVVPQQPQQPPRNSVEREIFARRQLRQQQRAAEEAAYLEATGGNIMPR